MAAARQPQNRLAVGAGFRRRFDERHLIFAVFLARGENAAVVGIEKINEAAVAEMMKNAADRKQRAAFAREFFDLRRARARRPRRADERQPADEKNERQGEPHRLAREARLARPERRPSERFVVAAGAIDGQNDSQKQRRHKQLRRVAHRPDEGEPAESGFWYCADGDLRQQARKDMQKSEREQHDENRRAALRAFDPKNAAQKGRSAKAARRRFHRRDFTPFRLALFESSSLRVKFKMSKNALVCRRRQPQFPVRNFAPDKE